MAQFDNLTCPQMAAKRGELGAELANVSAHQAAAHTSDTWGVLLIGLPVGSMGGGDHEKEIAELKGEQAAIEQEIATKCTTGA